jgi:competence protein ComEA
MHKKIISTLSFITVFALFGVAVYCIFNGPSVEAEEKEKPIVKEEKEIKSVFVDIKGAINNPGVYEMSSESRIIDVIKEAGDLTEDADTSLLNLSKKVEDEMYIIIYTKDEINEYNTKQVNDLEEKYECPDEDNDACLKPNKDNTIAKVNINTASQDALETLPGIGPSKAESIIKYRETNKFNSIEDIKNVSGIGDALYEKIKDLIEV